MSEPTNLKYDPDNFDPILVKDYKSPWGLVVPICFALVSDGMYVKSILISPFRQAYQPGNWIGMVHLGMGAEELLIVMIFGIVAFVSALIFRRGLLALGMILTFTSLLYFMPSRFGSGDPMPRFRVEHLMYEKAVASHTKFGDQYSEEINGRTLIYWRWMTWNLDNAVGVIYDPMDKLSTKEDHMAFRDPSTGVLFHIQKIEPKWYFVEHS